MERGINYLEVDRHDLLEEEGLTLCIKTTWPRRLRVAVLPKEDGSNHLEKDRDDQTAEDGMTV